MTLTPTVRIAGGLQVLIALANLSAVRMFRYREGLRAVWAHVAEVFWVQNVFIVLTMLGTAGLCSTISGDLAGGSHLGRALSGFVAVFWCGLGFQLFFYDRAIGYVVAVFAVAAAGVGVSR